MPAPTHRTRGASQRAVGRDFQRGIGYGILMRQAYVQALRDVRPGFGRQAPQWAGLAALCQKTTPEGSRAPIRIT